jgi:ABC-2 type transport system permease protein
MRRRWTRDIANIVAVARREIVTRVNTRGFVLSTAILVVASFAVAFIPVIVGYIDRTATESIGVHSGVSDLPRDPAATLDAMLNASGPSGDAAAAAGATQDFTIEDSPDLDAARKAVEAGELGALVDIERGPRGDLAFTIFVKDPAMSRTGDLIAQAAASIAIADRLGRAGLSGAQQAQLFEPPSVTVRSPDASKPAVTSESTANEVSGWAVTLGLVMFLFLAVIMYGTWVAMSVVEEKSNRVMEVVLAAATPFQLLAGKVIGVSATALLQYAAVLVAALLALLVQGEVARAVLGQSGGLSLPPGLTPAILVVFSIYFVLGFLLYAVLFAAAGSLVSRQEDVSQVVTPMTLLATAGCLIGVYASMGLIDAQAPWLIALSWIPFLAPYMMLSRFSDGSAAPVELVATMLLLAVTIVAATWVAARIYSAGVLMYGQRPGLRRMWTVIREGR